MAKILIHIGDELFQFTLPPTLFRWYMDTILSLERDEGDTHTNGLVRRDIHSRLVEWWQEKMPHVPAEEFNASLERAVERALPIARYYRRSIKS